MWVKEKPNKGCWFIAYDGDCNDEPYRLLQIIEVSDSNGSYLTLCLPDGDEWAALDEFEADWYLILNEPGGGVR